MDITPLLRPDQKVIQSYGGGKFRINGELFTTPLLIFDTTVSLWQASGDPFVPDEQIQHLKGRVDILLVGMGSHHKVIPPSQRAVWKDIGFTVDFMDTAAACRTYNVLTAEGRRVAAALIPVSV